MLTQKQIDFYHEQGYLGIENVLPDELVTELRRVTDDFVEQSRAHTEHTDVFDSRNTIKNTSWGCLRA